VILPGFTITGFVVVLGHQHGTFPITSAWFSLKGIVATGVILMLVARFILRSEFFQIARETAAREG
jgi:hypothetical protein